MVAPALRARPTACLLVPAMIAGVLMLPTGAAAQDQPPEMNLDNPGLDPFVPVVEPLGPWHELWPNFCTTWDAIDWLDNGNGVLDFCDYLLLDEPTAPEPTWWHVENVTLTVFFDEVEPPYTAPFYMDWPGELPPDPVEFNPIGFWHEVFPEFCRTWECIEWIDNGNGILDFCDVLCFIDPNTGGLVCMHVAELATDIDVIQEDPFQPPRKWLDNPDHNPFEPIPDPLGPWHELWPDYCTTWGVTGWVDNGSGVLDVCDYLRLESPDGTDPTWWHVENVTLTVFFDEVDPPYAPPLYMDWPGPLPDDPFQFNPIGPWHEIFPEFCKVWECFHWEDTNANGLLDFCDWLCFFDPVTGLDVCMHVAELATDIEIVREDPPLPPRKWLDNPDHNPFEPIPDPLGPWHELWPQFCTTWDVTGWVDNGSGVLDVCDYLLLENPDEPAPTWWHVENVTLTVFFDEVDPPYAPPVYMDWPGDLPPDPTLFNPIGPWHEIFPGFCTVWECIDWVDNGNGVLDFCDVLIFIDPVTGGVVGMHVAELATDIEIVREDPPLPPRKWLDNPGLNPFEPIPDPRGPWHELWPVFCQTWDVTGWIDNGTGVLDVCDYLKLEQPTHAPSWWHVETVTVTVLVTPEPPGFPPMYLDWTGPFMTDPFDPVGPWHEIYPAFCTDWICEFWDDSGNNSGVLDFCDWLLIFNPVTGDQFWAHVEEVATDIEVVEGPPPCPWDCGDGNGTVGTPDLLSLLAQWGTVDAPCDIDGGGVGTTDLLALLAHWGPCP